MKRSTRFMMAGAVVLAAAAPALASVNGRTTTRCTAPLQIADVSPTGPRAETYTLRLSGSNAASYTDYGFDLRAKGGMRTQPLCDLVGFTWTRPDNDREFAMVAGSDASYVIVTLPPEAAGGACRVLIDSGRSDDPTMDSVTWQYVGAGNGWTMAPTQPGARGTKAATGTFSGAELQFGMVSEVEPPGRAPLGTNCFIGGNYGRQQPGGVPANGIQGLIVGYNVYRIPGTAGTTPTLADFMRADAWQYYVDALTFDNDMDAMGLPGPQRPGGTAASDNAPDDLAGLQNQDGVFYTGEERLFFQDTPFLPNRMPRPYDGMASQAMVNAGYWYAAQPVLSMGGLVNATAFGAVGFTNNSVFNGNHVINLAVTGGSWQAIDLDLDGTPEFINPQVVGGDEGLGLTNNNLLLLSAPVFADTSSAALPADTQVTLNAEMSGSRVNIQFSLGLTAGDVRGFNVYRIAGPDRAVVNAVLIPSQGGEGSVYSVVDEAIGTARRVRRDAAVQYELEIVYADGTTRTVGPFDVVTSARETGRRTR